MSPGCHFIKELSEAKARILNNTRNIVLDSVKEHFLAFQITGPNPKQNFENNSVDMATLLTLCFPPDDLLPFCRAVLCRGHQHVLTMHGSNHHSVPQTFRVSESVKIMVPCLTELPVANTALWSNKQLGVTNKSNTHKVDLYC